MRTRCPRPCLAAALTIGLAPAAAAQEMFPIFELSFDPCPRELVLPAGSSAELTVDCVLTSRDDPLAAGAQGWNFGFQVAGLRVLDITTRGTIAARVDDDPPGLRHPQGHEVSEHARCGTDPAAPRDMGAVSSVVLSFIAPATLPPEGAHVVARATLLVEAPAAAGERKPAGLFYRDDCRGRGSPYDSAVTWRGYSVPPVQGSCELEIVAGEPAFRRGDANDDGKIDVSDVIGLLGCKFRGEPCASCRDAMDANDDGRDDISDAIRIFAYLFQAGAPTPAPGPVACGPDPTPDLLAPCLYLSCEE